MRRATPIIVGGIMLLGGALALAQYEGTGDLKILKPEDKQDVKSTPPPAGPCMCSAGADHRTRNAGYQSIPPWYPAEQQRPRQRRGG